MKEYFDEATKNLPACSSILAGVRVWIYVGIYTYIVWQLHTVYQSEVDTSGWMLTVFAFSVALYSILFAKAKP